MISNVPEYYENSIRQMKEDDYQRSLLNVLKDKQHLLNEDVHQILTLEEFDDFYQRDYRVEKEYEDLSWPIYLRLLPYLEDVYLALNLDKEVLDESLKDLFWRLNHYQEQNGVYGLSSEDKMWLARIYHIRIFKIGALQYEWVRHGESESIDGLQLSGEGVLSLHIMYGEDISRSSCLGSFQRALCFFKRHFPQQHLDYFYCQSWLLYPNNLQALSSKSRIRQFMDLFEIVDQYPDTELPYQYIFYKPVHEVSQDDVNSSFQSFAYDHPDQLGIGTGIIKIQDVRRMIHEEE